QLDLPDVCRAPAPVEYAVRSIPVQRSRLLSRKEDRSQCGVQDFVGTRPRPSEGGKDLCSLGEDMPAGQRGRSIAILPLILQKENPSAQGGFLINVSESMITVPRQQFYAQQRASADLLLPARARN